MRKLIEFFINRPIFGDLLTVVVIGIGCSSLFLIKREVFPNVSFDVIQISTIFPGATPEEVEKQITNPLEQDLKEISGMKRVNSYSVDNLSNIFITLDPDETTGAKVKEEAKDIIEQIDDLPKDAEKTIVKELESKEEPIIEINLFADVSPLELRKKAKELEKEIETLKGVAKVSHRGLQDLEIKVEVSAKKLAQYRLTLDSVAQALQMQNSSIPAGTIESTDPLSARPEQSVRTVGDFKNADDVAGTVIRANEAGRAIRVKDVAKVYLGLSKQNIINYTNGKPSLGLTVMKEEKADAIEVVERVKAHVDTLKPTLLKDTNVSYINDMSEYVARRLSILTGNLGLGLLLVLLLLPLMLPFRFSMIIALGEPFAFLGAIAVMYLIGASINLISMLGLIIVSGILVDDSIVVTENAVRLIEDEGVDPKVAAIEGTMQIISPVTASVLTTTMAFLPMAFMSGVFGKFVREVPIAVITCMGVSLFETFFILPGHVAHWVKARSKEDRKKADANLVARFLHKSRDLWDQKFVPIYTKYLAFTLRHRYWVAAGLAVLFAGSLILATTGMRFILFPPEGIEIFFVRTKVATGSSLERHRHLLLPLEKVISSLPKDELKDLVTTIGIQQQDPYDPLTRRGAEYAQFTVYLTPESDRDRSADAIIEDVRKKLGKPEHFEEISFNRVNPGPPVGKPVSLGIRGANFKELKAAAEDMKKTLGAMPGVSDIADSFTLGKEELKIKIRPEEAASVGLSASQVGVTVRGAFEGLVPTNIRDVEEKIDVRVILDKSERESASTLEAIFIPNSFGNLIPFSQVATVGKGQGLSVYEHEDFQRQVKVTAEVDSMVTQSNIVNDKVRGLLSEFKQRHPHVTVDFGGEDKDTAESMASLGRAFIVAIMGIFLMLVLTFKRLIQPLVILLTIPLGMIAVIWAFFLHNMPLSFMGMLGIIALSGVIVNNAIMLVDFVNQARERGMSHMDSILEAGKSRVRPIFLTTVTTIIGVIPTAYGIGGLDKFVVPIAMALGWGLLFGSVLTAFVFPSALAILDDINGIFERRFPKLANFYKH